MAPRITAVIPTYNRADLVIRAVQIARAQTVRPIEIIVVDDGRPMTLQRGSVNDFRCAISASEQRWRSDSTQHRSSRRDRRVGRIPRLR